MNRVEESDPSKRGNGFIPWCSSSLEITLLGTNSFTDRNRVDRYVITFRVDDIISGGLPKVGAQDPHTKIVKGKTYDCMFNMDQDSGPGNLQAFLCGVLPHHVLANGRIDMKILADSATNKCEELHGLEASLDTDPILTRANKEFTVHKWSPAVYEDEDEDEQ